MYIEIYIIMHILAYEYVYLIFSYYLFAMFEVSSIFLVCLFVLLYILLVIQIFYII